MTNKKKFILGMAGILLATAAVILYSEKKSNYRMSKRIKKAGKHLKGSVDKAARHLKDKYENVKHSAEETMRMADKKFPATMQ